MKIGYLFTDLPDQEGTFAFAELEEMAARGVQVEIFCLRSRLPPGSGARALLSRFVVHRTPYLSARALGALLITLVRNPGIFLRNLWHSVRETVGSPRILIKTLGILPKCCLFARIVNRDGDLDLLQAYWASLPGRAAWWISSLTGVPYGTWAHAGADIYNRRHQTEAALRTTLSGATRIMALAGFTISALLSRKVRNLDVIMREAEAVAEREQTSSSSVPAVNN